jgi:hypothetical protein
MRYVLSSEAAWRIFQFEMSGRSHAFVRLPVNQPNQQTVFFDADAENNADVLARNERTMLTEWFKLKFKFFEVVEESELSTADDFTKRITILVFQQNDTRFSKSTMRVVSSFCSLTKISRSSIVVNIFVCR